MFAQGHRSLAIVGGEPTVHERLFDWAADARALGFETILLQTNGRRLACSGYARGLVQAGVSCIELSLAGPRRAIHEFHTQAPGSFSQSMAGAVKARLAGLQLGVTFVITRSNFRHMTEMVDFATRLGIQTVHLSIVRPRGAALRNFGRIVPRFELLSAHLRDALILACSRHVQIHVSGLPHCLVDQGPAPEWLRFVNPNAFDARCTRCSCQLDCTGVDASYASRYGWHEFKPQADDVAERLGTPCNDVRSKYFVGSIDS
jgi:MoaA/NifB/PqqE/SkfB family radical SAM enzyme